ncbi:unnamed protein product [Phaedon cochleariae]|uniref:Uncharacterized protein n=1 Tax=Phaedon cochleariae TaxID=80249 RepID=A0A9P0DPD6_PHACE|nr:unnamed protein product [Phaedon cochleariae]
MTFRAIIFVAIAIASLHQLAQAAILKKGDGQFELRLGNCNDATMADLVFQDHVHLTRIPFVTRSAESSWHGNERIICIIALSQKEQSKGSTVSITAGGINQHFVTLKMKSGSSHGLEYNIQVFGRM